MSWSEGKADQGAGADQVTLAGPKSDAEALEIGVKKFNDMAQLFYGELEPPIRFHINSYARGLLILAIGPESAMQLELNSPSSHRQGNVLRLWMNWVLREMLYLFIAQFIETDAPGGLQVDRIPGIIHLT